MKPKNIILSTMLLLVIVIYFVTGRNGHTLRLSSPELNQWLYLPAIFQPAVFYVNTTQDAPDVLPGNGSCRTVAGHCSLRAAIQETNALAGPDEIFVPAGTYFLTIAGTEENAAATGDLDITDSLHITGLDPATTIINANQLDRAIHMVVPLGSSIDVTISGLTVANGKVHTGELGGGGILNQSARLMLSNVIVRDNQVGDWMPQGWGGGIAVTHLESSAGLTLTLHDSVVTHNIAIKGGGISASAQSFTAINSTISNNEAALAGGGIYTNAISNTLTTMTITNNTVLEYLGGGGVYLAGEVANITNSQILDNEASDVGGGIFNQSSGPVVISNSTIAGNQALGNSSAIKGGGIYQHGNADTLTVIDSTITGNHAFASGGGLYIDSDHLTHVYIQNSTISHNTAQYFGMGIYTAGILHLTNVTVSNNRFVGHGNGWGAGIYTTWFLPQTNLTIVNSTITANQGNKGAGIYRDDINGTSGSVSVLNSIIAHNVAPLSPNCHNTIVSLGYNIQNDFSCSFGAVGDLSGVTPVLGPLQTNGGPTFTHALLSGSPAIDAGTNINCPPADQRGVSRPRDGNGDGHPVCDIGAFEK